MLESQSPVDREPWRIREHKRLLGACQKFQVLLAFLRHLTPNEFLLREIAADGRRWIVAERNDLDRLIKASLRRPDRHLDEFGLSQILCELFYFVGCHDAAATQKGPNVEWPHRSLDVISSQADLQPPGHAVGDACTWRNPEPLRLFPASRHRNWNTTELVREVSISRHTIIWPGSSGMVRKCIGGCAAKRRTCRISSCATSSRTRCLRKSHN